jgi:hypothetical protein
MSTTVAVDGPENVERVYSTVQRILTRARQRQQSNGIDNDCVLYFILRLDGQQHDAWKSSLESTLKSIVAIDGESRLVGLSFFDVAEESDNKDSDVWNKRRPKRNWGSENAGNCSGGLEKRTLDRSYRKGKGARKANVEVRVSADKKVMGPAQCLGIWDGTNS